MSYEEEDTCHMRRKILVRGTQGDHSLSLSLHLPPSLSRSLTPPSSSLFPPPLPLPSSLRLLPFSLPLPPFAALSLSHPLSLSSQAWPRRNRSIFKDSAVRAPASILFVLSTFYRRSKWGTYEEEDTCHMRRRIPA